MMFRCRHPLAVATLATALSIGAGCAKDPTAVSVTVNADTTVLPLLILRTIVTVPYDPAHTVSSERSSPYASDAGDRPGPFVFPLVIALTVDPSLAGDVTITVEGLDWDTHIITAWGDTAASVVAEKTTDASLTLHPTAMP
jgi:hypothetical protein